MKTVFDNYGLAHAFASGSLDSGRSNNGNFYFSGDTLFSYGAHYPVAHLDRKNKIAYMNSSSSSMTTQSKHKPAARSALSHFEVVLLPAMGHLVDNAKAKSFCNLSKEGLAKYINRISEDIEELIYKRNRMRSEFRIKANIRECELLELAAQTVWKLHGRRGNCFGVAKRDSKKAIDQRIADRLNCCLADIQKRNARDGSYINKLKELIYPAESSTFNDYSRHLSWIEVSMTRTHLSLGFEIGATICDKKTATRIMGKEWIVEGEKQRNEWNQYADDHLLPELQKAREYYQSLINERMKEIKQEWLKGEKHGTLLALPMTLRIISDKLQTSKGASVPLQDAIKLTTAAALCRKNNKEWKRNGEIKNVGMFSCDRITKKGDLIVGCHNIPWSAVSECIKNFENVLPKKLTSMINELN